MTNMDTPTYRSPNDLKSPIFVPRPGWGGRLKRWSRDNGLKLIAIVVVLAVGTAIAVDQIRDDKDDAKDTTAKASASPSPSSTPKTAVSGSSTQHYEFRAAPGQGITHLARYAVSGYTQDNPGTQLGPEQRVFAEDYLKDQKIQERGSRWLEINEAISFEVSDVKSAINAALALTAEQIRAIARFARMIVGF